MAEVIDWSKTVSNQIAVVKTDKALLELLDKLKPAGKRYPAHIHAAREADEDGRCSLICLQAVDYSRGTGEKSVSVYANISPEEAQFIYSRVFGCAETFVFSQDKIFGEKDEDGYARMTKLYITRNPRAKDGKLMERPWYVNIKNGAGIPKKNRNGGTYCESGSFVSDKEVSLNLKDAEFFRLFCRADAWIRAFELEHSFKARRQENFKNLYLLLKKEIWKVLGGNMDNKDNRSAA